MEIDLHTPALLFPALSLLMLAYTNRFLSLANVIRSLHAQYLSSPDPSYLLQIKNLRRRVFLVRNMQFCGICSLLLCTLSMSLIFAHWMVVAVECFGLSLLLMISSFVFSLIEIHISVDALNHHLKDLEGKL